MKFSKVDIFGYPVFNDKLSVIDFSGKVVISTLNGHSYTVAKADSEFKKALHESEILLPDGVSVVIGTKLLRGQDIKKIAGYDLFLFLMNYLERKKGSCFFLGSTGETLERIEMKIKVEYPNVKVASYSPPYKSVFLPADNAIMQNKINAFNPNVLFVGMTAPKQEKWVNANRNKIDANVICSIGAVFDFYAGTSKRPPQWLINLKLEWLGRLVKEPKRMWRRYLLSTPIFFIDVFLAVFKLKKKS